MSDQLPRDRKRLNERPRPKNSDGRRGAAGSSWNAPSSASETGPNGTGGTGGGSNGGGQGGGSGGAGKGGGFNWKPIAATAVAVALAVAGVLAFSGAGGGGDDVSQEETNQRQAAYEGLVAAGGMPLQLVSAAEVDQAIADMPESVSEAQREELRQDVNQGRVRLAWVTVWDTMAEDGDVLRFESSASIPIEVMAMNAKTTFAIPYPVDGKVLVTGVRDGGGGITIALESGAAQINWPTMRPGDTLNLPVTQGY